MIYKTLKKVSNVCQLMDKSKYPTTRTINGVTFTNNGDGSITVNGMATERAIFNIQTPNYFPSNLIGHKCLLEPNTSLTIVPDTINIHATNWDVSNIKPIGEITATPKIRISVFQGYTANNIVFKPQLFDLTEMYGAGNEPTTVEQFRQDFPDEMYDYSPHCFVKSYKNCLKVSNVCQLLKPNFLGNQTLAGVTCTSNGNTFTLNGTSSGETSISVPIYYITSKGAGHKFLISGCPQGAWSSYSIFFGALNQGTQARDYGNGAIFTSTTAGNYVGVAIKRAGVTFDNLVLKPQLFDLTEMYGAGNEPTTVEQFRADFPNELYDYKPYSIVPSYKKSLVCTTKNLFDIPLIQGYPSNTDFGNTTARTFTIGTYIIGLSANNYYIPGNVTNVNISKNSIYCSIKGSRYGVSIPYLLTIGNSYTLSCKIDNNYYPNIGITFYKEDGTLITYTSPELITNTFVKSFTVPENTYYTLILFSGMANNEYTFSNIQLEEGSTATEYHPYGYL